MKAVLAVWIQLSCLIRMAHWRLLSFLFLSPLLFYVSCLATHRLYAELRVCALHLSLPGHGLTDAYSAGSGTSWLLLPIVAFADLPISMTHHNARALSMDCTSCSPMHVGSSLFVCVFLAIQVSDTGSFTARLFSPFSPLWHDLRAGVGTCFLLCMHTFIEQCLTDARINEYNFWTCLSFWGGNRIKNVTFILEALVVLRTPICLGSTTRKSRDPSKRTIVPSPLTHTSCF